MQMFKMLRAQIVPPEHPELKEMEEKVERLESLLKKMEAEVSAKNVELVERDKQIRALQKLIKQQSAQSVPAEGADAAHLSAGLPPPLRSQQSKDKVLKRVSLTEGR